MSERYKAVEGSESAHCCFEATVVDTQTPHPLFCDDPDWVCECFDMESAQKIADALNAAQQPAEQQPAPDVAGLVGKMGRLIAAGNRLNGEAEECIYDDGMSEVAGSEYWCEFRGALEAATEALAAHRKQEPNHD